MSFNLGVRGTLRFPALVLGAGLKKGTARIIFVKISVAANGLIDAKVVFLDAKEVVINKQSTKIMSNTFDDCELQRNML